ncbi:hypothetical protein, partial [Gardnerella vaginalis]|uniref:hypothetical protein n=1 Tax=Gardnerella vaginalis TaxID=2702 RepID=UPI001C729037
SPLQTNFNPKKQNQNQNGTTATTTNTQKAERCETRISQPSYNNKQGRCTIPNKKARNSKQVRERAIYQY